MSQILNEIAKRTDELEKRKASLSQMELENQSSIQKISEKSNNDFENIKKQLTEKDSLLSKSISELNSARNELMLTSNLNKELLAKLTKSEQNLNEILKVKEQVSKEKQDLQATLTKSEQNSKQIAKERDELIGKLNKIESEKQQISKQYQEVYSKLKLIEEEKERKRKLESENQELADFLNSLNLSQFFSKFQSESIEVETLEYFSDQEFEKLGLNMGQRKKLMLAIKKGIGDK